MSNDPTRDIEVYSIGICRASVCTAIEDLNEITDKLNASHPTGISSLWTPSEDKTFEGGEPNPCECNDKPKTHKHYLFEC